MMNSGPLAGPESFTASALPITKIEFQSILKKSHAFAQESRLRSWSVFLTCLALLSGALVLTLPHFHISLRLVASVIAGLLMVRLFTIYHDYEHGAILRNSRVAKVMMTIVGTLLMRPPADWKRSHNFHHQHNSKLPGNTIGAFPIMSTDTYLKASAKQQFMYRLARSPLIVATGYITCFLMESAKKLSGHDEDVKNQSVVALIVHASLAVATCAIVGFTGMLITFLAPFVISCCVGAYLFFIQHSFSDIEFYDEQDWEFGLAALNSSSCLKGNRLIHWLSGNIGYHHIHHLNPKIPFYRLPEAMKAIVELSRPRTVTLHPAEIVRSFRLKLWDVKTRTMVGFPTRSAAV